MAYLFIVYDARANAVDGTDDALVWVCEDTQKQAERWSEPGYVWRYRIVPGKTDKLVDETFIGPTKVLAAEQHEAARRKP